MAVKRRIDLNCDLGEGMPNDAELMPYISSCNIACGGHFGSKETIRATIKLARKHSVKIGAHPSYPDQENFGRKSMKISASDLKSSLKRQLFDFLSVCDEEAVEANHIKLHGALYNDTAKDQELADAVLEVYEEMKLTLPFYVAPTSLLRQKKVSTLIEVFVDRSYENDGNLVSRSHPNALIKSPADAWQRLKRMYVHREVISIHGVTFPVDANTFCVHGDTENAQAILQYIDAQLKLFNITLDKNG